MVVKSATGNIIVVIVNDMIAFMEVVEISCRISSSLRSMSPDHEFVDIAYCQFGDRCDERRSHRQ